MCSLLGDVVVVVAERLKASRILTMCALFCNTGFTW